MNRLYPALLLLVACEPDPESTSLFRNVGMSFEACNEAEIRHRNDKYNLMPALKVCGSNNVAHFAWNPRGTHLYFDLTLTGNLIDHGQAHKPLSTLPIDQPTGHPAWISDQRLVVPIIPDPRQRRAPERLALYDIEQLTLELKPVPDLTDLTDVQRGRTPSEVFFTGIDAQGTRRAWRLDLDDGSVAPAFGWLGPVDTLSVTVAAGAVVATADGTITLYDFDGETKGSWPGLRGTVHPDGTWLAIEKLGEEVSIFYQRSWENQTRRERELTQQKAERMASRFPDWYPKTVQLPTLEFVHLPSGHRGELYSVYGTRFQWYERQSYWGSFILWGYEGKNLNRNVQLGNLTLQLGAISARKHMPDIRLLDDEGRRISDPDADAAP